MKKRGLIVLGAGIVLVAVSLGIAAAALPSSDPTMTGELFTSNLFEDIFDHTSEESLVYSGSSASFTYTANQDSPLLWILQITDFEEGDTTQISISNIFGDDFGSVESDEPVTFNTFVAEQTDDYTFEVQNTGDRDVTVVMMFAENPDDSMALANPDSPLHGLVIQLAISGAFLLVGFVTALVGAVLSIVDWKKEKKQSSYY